jgi:hypothetical protein
MTALVNLVRDRKDISLRAAGSFLCWATVGSGKAARLGPPYRKDVMPEPGTLHGITSILNHKVVRERQIMNLKSKLFGLTAATMLSIGAVTGVAAQHSFTDTDLHVELVPNICSVSASTSNVTFGPWEFDGKGEYVLVGSHVRAIHWDMTVPGPGQSCDVNFSMFGSALKSGDNRIGSENVSFSVYNYGAVGNLGAKKTVSLNPSHTGGAFYLNVPEDAQPGEYSGTIRIETQNAD